MHESEVSTRATLIRNGVKFQLKLMADGFRDLVLVPVSLFATLIGLLRGGEDAERELNQVIELGRQSEKWICLVLMIHRITLTPRFQSTPFSQRRKKPSNNNTRFMTSADLHRQKLTRPSVQRMKKHVPTIWIPRVNGC